MIDELRLEQQQQLSQQQIQSLQLLAMDNIELEGFLQNEHLENPLLEYSSQGTGLRKGEVDAFWNRDIRESAAEENKIKPYLQEQLPMEKFTKKEWELFEFLIDCLDEHGFFKGNIDEIAKMNHISCQMVEKCLEELRLLEPVGIFAENLQECLLRQLEVLGISNPELEKIIKEHLEDVAEGKISSISRELKLSTLQVRKYIAMIEHLNPCPMAGFSTGETKYIVPDMIAVQGESGWEILLNDSWMGDYGLNDYYIHMMKETKDAELYEYFQKKLERARFIVNSIEQRRKTLLMIGNTLLEHQKGYFEGKEPLRPMTMTALAKELGINSSTVSRAIKGKYIQSPRGTLELKSLFSAGVHQNGGEKGEAVTADEIKNQIFKLIKAEDKRKPYSDTKLVQLLQQESIQISRRAVAKYREEMGIRGSFERKEE